MKKIETIISSFEVRDQLPSDIWYNPKGVSLKESDSKELKLNPEIRKRLLEIAELFIDTLKVDFFVNDIVVFIICHNVCQYQYIEVQIVLSDFFWVAVLLCLYTINEG